VFPAEHLFRFGGIHAGGQIVERAAQIVGDGLPRPGPLDEDGDVVQPPGERSAQLEILFEPPAPLQELLGGRLILPEIRLRDAFFYLREFVGRTCAVKDGSAGPRPGGRGPRTCEADPLSVGPRKHLVVSVDVLRAIRAAPIAKCRNHCN
jgi:hypothetical protein